MPREVMGGVIMTNNTAKRIGRPTKKILGYVADAYSKNFNGIVLPFILNLKLIFLTIYMTL